MRHCASLNCRDCKRRRALLYPRPKIVVPDGWFWDRKIVHGSGEVLGYWPPGSTLESFVRRA